MSVADNLSKFFSELVVGGVFIYVVWIWYDRRRVVNENEKLKSRNNAEILADLHNHISNESVEQLIGEPDDIASELKKE